MTGHCVVCSLCCITTRHLSLCRTVLWPYTFSYFSITRDRSKKNQINVVFIMFNTVDKYTVYCACHGSYQVLTMDPPIGTTISTGSMVPLISTGGRNEPLTQNQRTAHTIQHWGPKCVRASNAKHKKIRIYVQMACTHTWQETVLLTKAFVDIYFQRKNSQYFYHVPYNVRSHHT